VDSLFGLLERSTNESVDDPLGGVLLPLISSMAVVRFQSSEREHRDASGDI